MVSNFRIFTGILSGYVGMGLLFDTIISHIINHSDIRKLLRLTIDPPLWIRVFNLIFLPIRKVMGYIRIQSILTEERLEEFESIFGDEEDYEE